MSNRRADLVVRTGGVPPRESRAARVLQECTRAPYLALVLAVDVDTIRKLYDEVAESGPERERARAAETHRADPGLFDALHRYLALADSRTREHCPLISKEIHYRLLVAPFGGMLGRLIRHEAQRKRHGRAIGQIRGDIRSPMRSRISHGENRDERVVIPRPSDITSTTPLQYQEETRLLEARRSAEGGRRLGHHRRRGRVRELDQLVASTHASSECPRAGTWAEVDRLIESLGRCSRRG